jgi:hypothetical protein
MKSLLTIVASVFAVSAFAAGLSDTTTPAKKEEAKPAATAKAATPAKSEAKTTPTKDAKAAK